MSFLPINLQSEHSSAFHRLMVDIAGQLFQSEFIWEIETFINAESPKTIEEAIENNFERQERELNEPQITLEDSDLAREIHNFLRCTISRMLNASEKFWGDNECCDHEYEIHKKMLNKTITKKKNALILLVAMQKNERSMS